MEQSEEIPLTSMNNFTEGDREEVTTKRLEKEVSEYRDSEAVTHAGHPHISCETTREVSSETRNQAEQECLLTNSADHGNVMLNQTCQDRQDKDSVLDCQQQKHSDGDTDPLSTQPGEENVSPSSQSPVQSLNKSEEKTDSLYPLRQQLMEEKDIAVNCPNDT